MDKIFFDTLIGQRVKVRYLDDGLTHVVKGVLQEVNDTYIVVDDVVVGLGSNFISCVKQKEMML